MAIVLGNLPPSFNRCFKRLVRHGLHNGAGHLGRNGRLKRRFLFGIYYTLIRSDAKLNMRPGMSAEGLRQDTGAPSFGRTKQEIDRKLAIVEARRRRAELVESRLAAQEAELRAAENARKLAEEAELERIRREEARRRAEAELARKEAEEQQRKEQEESERLRLEQESKLAQERQQEEERLAKEREELRQAEMAAAEEQRLAELEAPNCRKKWNRELQQKQQWLSCKQDSNEKEQ